MENNDLNYSTADYFNIRAPRYSNAINTFPLSRSLDLIPYCFFLKDAGSNLNFLDAFCGPGFISNSFSKIDHKFVLADVSMEMIKHSNINHDNLIVRENFKNLLEKYGKGFFDIIVSHGGFHHAVSLVKNKIDKTKSDKKHQSIVINLSKLLAKGGLLILADIPKDNSNRDFDNTGKSYCLSQFEELIGLEALKLISSSLQIDLMKPFNLIDFYNTIKRKIPNTNPRNIPRYYFDNFIAKKTKYGHIAHYPDFAILKDQLEYQGLENIALINYQAPWIFDTNRSAGWFFKEKFSIDRRTKPGENFELDNMMYEIINQYLGVTNLNNFSFVNWGVTYAIFKKHE